MTNLNPPKMNLFKIHNNKEICKIIEMFPETQNNCSSEDVLFSLHHLGFVLLFYQPISGTLNDENY